MADSGRPGPLPFFVGDDPFQQPASNTLPEHYSALSVMQQLDHFWFRDNILKLRVGVMSTSSILSPYRSIELMEALDNKLGASSSSSRLREMPRARFEPLPPSRAATSSRPSRKSPLEGSRNPGHRLRQEPQTALPLVARRQIWSSPLADTVLTPPGALQAWIVKDFRALKGVQLVENSPHSRKLESIKSGKQLKVSLADSQPQLLPGELETKLAKKDQRKSSKSMTALEFDELQGFKDLGFHFGQDDLTPRIVNMFPALRHKLGEDGEARRSPRASFTKPKQGPPEAWLVRRSASPLHRWQTPATSEDMKEHLKFWARAVASTVRQEC